MRAYLGREEECRSSLYFWWGKRLRLSWGCLRGEGERLVLQWILDQSLERILDSGKLKVSLFEVMITEEKENVLVGELVIISLLLKGYLNQVMSNQCLLSTFSLKLILLAQRETAIFHFGPKFSQVLLFLVLQAILSIHFSQVNHSSLV